MQHPRLLRFRCSDLLPCGASVASQSSGAGSSHFLILHSAKLANDRLLLLVVAARPIAATSSHFLLCCTVLQTMTIIVGATRLIIIIM
jgi:hypothetical protein